MELKTAIRKGCDGWKAETNVALEAPYILRISTYKSSRGLVTNAQRFKVERGMISFEMFGDFNQQLLLTSSRCTEKSVTAQHNSAITADAICALKSRCTAFYAEKDAKEASRLAA